MFIYSDFKMKIAEGKSDEAKKMLKDIEINAETFNAVSNVCMFLSLIFRYPDDEVYDTLKDNWDAFSEFIADYSENNPSLYEQVEMESDYIKLFEQDIEGNKIIPYISYYTEKDKVLYGESTFKIREWMAEEGFVLNDDVTDIEDRIHIVLEFTAMLFRHLADPENIEDWYRSLRNLYNVLDNYGPVVADEFAALVAKRDDKPFYRDFAKVLAGFIKDLDPIMEDILKGED